MNNRKEKLLHCLNAPEGINKVYFGGMARCMMCRIIGIRYGYDSLRDAVKTAPPEVIDKIYERMGDSIKGVWKHGLGKGATFTQKFIWVRPGFDVRITPPDDPEFWTRYKIDRSTGADR